MSHSLAPSEISPKLQGPMDGRISPNSVQGSTDHRFGPIFKGMKGSTDRRISPNFEKGIQGPTDG